MSRASPSHQTVDPRAASCRPRRRSLKRWLWTSIFAISTFSCLGRPIGDFGEPPLWVLKVKPTLALAFAPVRENGPNQHALDLDNGIRLIVGDIGFKKTAVGIDTPEHRGTVEAIDQNPVLIE